MDPVKLVEKIKRDAPTLTIGGQKYYIVETDRKLLESELLAYAKEIASLVEPTAAQPPNLEGLVAATINGKPMRWELPAVLTWAIDEDSFSSDPDALAMAKTICTKATADWNTAAKETGIDNVVAFKKKKTKPLFKFVFDPNSDPNLYAVAFFPNDPASKRVVNIGPTTFVEPNDFDPVGVIRHELGHVLGFRHEHIRAPAQQGMTPAQKSQMEKWVTGGIGGAALTDYDSQSVMHYPLNGRGTLDFKLTDNDKAGFKKLYTLPAAQVKQFPV